MADLQYRPQAIVWQGKGAGASKNQGGKGGRGSVAYNPSGGDGNSSSSKSGSESIDGSGDTDWSSLLKQMQENQRYLTDKMNEHDVNMANINNTAAQRQTETQVQGNRDVATIQGHTSRDVTAIQGQTDRDVAGIQGAWSNQVTNTQGSWSNQVADTQGRWSNANINTEGQWESRLEGEKHGYRKAEAEQGYGFDLGRMEKQYSVSSRLQSERSTQEKSEEVNRMDQVIRKNVTDSQRAGNLWASRK